LSADKSERAFGAFVAGNTAGLRISLAAGSVNVDRFVPESTLVGGVGAHTKCPYEPVFLARFGEKEAALAEFESLIHGNCRESELERFIVAYFRDWHVL